MSVGRGELQEASTAVAEQTNEGSGAYSKIGPEHALRYTGVFQDLDLISTVKGGFHYIRANNNKDDLQWKR